MPRPSAPKKRRPDLPAAPIIQLKILLLDVNPVVWRRILVPIAYTLEELHGVIQVALGWQSFHLYHFNLRAVEYGSWELGASNPQVSLESLRFRKRAKFTYTYDMMSFWRHEIRVEDSMEAKPDTSYPFCVDGAQACPPEDCGGPEGYAERRLNAYGFEAMEDLATLADMVKTVVLEGKVDRLKDEEWRGEMEDLLERVKDREAFREGSFSPSAVNTRFAQDDHHVLMHQQLW